MTFARHIARRLGAAKSNPRLFLSLPHYSTFSALRYSKLFAVAAFFLPTRRKSRVAEVVPMAVERQASVKLAAKSL
jgi:hypothetical protein